MNPASYKDVSTSRGLKYHYYFSPAVHAKPTLLFVHGFPSTSYDWRHQVAFFEKEGYGLIVPDMLGYGGTDKPKDVNLYKHTGVTADIVDILDSENVHDVVVIGHDWGSVLASRLALYYPDRFRAFAFLAVGYLPPFPTFDIHQFLPFVKAKYGYETVGYWLFFGEDGADKIVEAHFDSFFSILYPNDPKLWITDLAPTGAVSAWLLSDKRCPLPPYVTEEDKERIKDTLLSGGLAGPLASYKLAISGSYVTDEKNMPKESHKLNHPVFYGAAAKDYIAVAEQNKATIKELCTNWTIKDFDTDHWVQLAVPDELNKELLAWIQTSLGA